MNGARKQELTIIPPAAAKTRFLGLILLHAGLLFAGIAAGAVRLNGLVVERKLPAPRTEPLVVTPLYDRPDVVDDRRLAAVLEKLQPRLRGPRPKINWVDHALRCWGVQATFGDARCLSGREMRELLLDHRQFADAWGTVTRPFLVPDLSGDSPTFSFRTQSGTASASHVDHTLAGLAEVGTPLDFPVITPAGEFPLSRAFERSLREFSLNQHEYEWSALAYIHYLPHVKSWHTTEGQQVDWDRLAERIMRQRLTQGICFGNHRLHALVVMLRIDDQHEILSPECRGKIVAHLRDVTARLVRTQHADGYWDGSWPGEEWDGPVRPKQTALGVRADRLLETGHVLEWWALAPAEILPPDETLTRAAHWVVREILELPERQVEAYYPFLTHAGRALALWRGKFPYELPQGSARSEPATVTAR